MNTTHTTNTGDAAIASKTHSEIVSGFLTVVKDEAAPDPQHRSLPERCYEVYAHHLITDTHRCIQAFSKEQIDKPELVRRLDTLYHHYANALVEALERAQRAEFIHMYGTVAFSVVSLCQAIEQKHRPTAIEMWIEGTDDVMIAEHLEMALDGRDASMPLPQLPTLQ